MGLPTQLDAERICAKLCGIPVRSVERFPLGLANFVYEVVSTDGSRVVVRLAEDRSPLVFDGTKYWIPRLKALGLPLPTILRAGEWEERAFLVLEHLPGNDLGMVYRNLTATEKRGIAREVARIQAVVGG